jgi:hypothetical protein
MPLGARPSDERLAFSMTIRSPASTVSKTNPIVLSCARRADLHSSVATSHRLRLRYPDAAASFLPAAVVEILGQHAIRGLTIVKDNSLLPAVKHFLKQMMCGALCCLPLAHVVKSTPRAGRSQGCVADGTGRGVRWGTLPPPPLPCSELPVPDLTPHWSMPTPKKKSWLLAEVDGWLVDGSTARWFQFWPRRMQYEGGGAP